MNLLKSLFKRAPLLAIHAGFAVCLALIFVGFALSPTLIFHYILKKPVQIVSIPLANNTTPLDKQNIVNYGLPARLIIPNINVDAIVEHLGVTTQGEMGVPKGPSNTAWFSLGPRPGEMGSSVIAGHYGWINNTPAAFDNIIKLQKGDKIYVKDENGETSTFIVRESRTFDQNADASSIFSSNDAKAHLNLITCDGDWNKTLQSYSNRLVVFADKE